VPISLHIQAQKHTEIIMTMINHKLGQANVIIAVRDP